MSSDGEVDLDAILARHAVVMNDEWDITALPSKAVAFYLAARTDVPALVARVRELESYSASLLVRCELLEATVVLMKEE